MGDLIKIVGVQYAVNSNHVKGEDMTAQEQQKTLDFLLRIMLKMLHFNANRNLFCNFVLRTAVITKFSFPKI